MGEAKHRAAHTVERATAFLESPIFLRTLGVSLVAAGLFGVAKGLFADLGEGEFWWGYLGAGILSMAFSAPPFFIASVATKTPTNSGGGGSEGHQLHYSKKGPVGQRTLH